MLRKGKVSNSSGAKLLCKLSLVILQFLGLCRGWWTPMFMTAGLTSATHFLKHFSRQNTLTKARRNISRHYDLVSCLMLTSFLSNMTKHFSFFFNLLDVFILTLFYTLLLICDEYNFIHFTFYRQTTRIWKLHRWGKYFF